MANLPPDSPSAWRPMLWHGVLRGYWLPSERIYLRRATRDHFCVRHHGWGLQDRIVDDLRRLGCRAVVVECRTEGGGLSILRTDFGNYLSHGIVDVLNAADGRQVFLDEGYFESVLARAPKAQGQSILERFAGARA